MKKFAERLLRIARCFSEENYQVSPRRAVLPTGSPRRTDENVVLEGKSKNNILREQRVAPETSDLPYRSLPSFSIGQYPNTALP